MAVTVEIVYDGFIVVPRGIGVGVGEPELGICEGDPSGGSWSSDYRLTLHSREVGRSCLIDCRFTCIVYAIVVGIVCDLLEGIPNAVIVCVYVPNLQVCVQASTHGRPCACKQLFSTVVFSVVVSVIDHGLAGVPGTAEVSVHEFDSGVAGVVFSVGV